jgi:hypothetical protein
MNNLVIIIKHKSLNRFLSSNENDFPIFSQKLSTLLNAE